MFTVLYKETGELTTVYHVNADKYGYPHFLIYHDRQWKYVSAKHYVPNAKESSYESKI